MQLLSYIILDGVAHLRIHIIRRVIDLKRRKEAHSCMAKANESAIGISADDS